MIDITQCKKRFKAYKKAAADLNRNSLMFIIYFLYFVWNSLLNFKPTKK